MPLLALAILLVAFLPSTPVAQGADQIVDLVLDVPDYVNGSEATATARLVVIGSPPLADMRLTWTGPDGSTRFTELVTPDPTGLARSRWTVSEEGVWRVNVTHTGRPPVSDEVGFRVAGSTWGPGEVYVSRSTVVGPGATLTVLPGSDVRFPPGVGLRIEGVLLSNGTGSEPVTFASSSPVPSPGAWEGLTFEPSVAVDSRLQETRVLHATTAVRVLGGAPVFASVELRENTAGIDLRPGAGTVEGILFEGNGVALQASGFTGRIANSTFRDNAFGLVLNASTVDAEGLLLSGGTVAAIVAEASTTVLRSTSLLQNEVGVHVRGGRAALEGVLVSGGDTALLGEDSADVLFSNGTLTSARTAAVWVETAARVTVRNAQVLPGWNVVALTGGTVVVENLLRVAVLRYEGGVPLEGARVEVTDSGKLVFAGTTDANGTTPSIPVADRVYRPTPFENVTRVRVSWGDLLFGANDRAVDMSTGHVEVFRGDARDNDADGEPDFSDPDDDNDDLPDFVEGTIGTDARNPDSDGDGMPDGWEFSFQLDPRADDAARDPDDDELPNLAEYRNGTNPRDRDTDDDAVPDGWEVGHGLDPRDASDADRDPDDDGFPNREEYRAGTDPRDPASHPTAPTDWGSAVSFALAVAAAIALIALVRRMRRLRQKDGP